MSLDKFEAYVARIKMDTQSPAVLLVVFRPDQMAELVLASDEETESTIIEGLRKVADQLEAAGGLGPVKCFVKQKGPPQVERP